MTIFKPNPRFFGTFSGGKLISATICLVQLLEAPLDCSGIILWNDQECSQTQIYFLPKYSIRSLIAIGRYTILFPLPCTWATYNYPQTGTFKFYGLTQTGCPGRKKIRFSLCVTSLVTGYKCGNQTYTYPLQPKP